MRTAIRSHVGALLLLFTTTTALLAQQQGPAYTAGELLVMLRPEARVEAVVQDLRMVNGTLTGLRVERVVSAPWRAWLLRFDAAALAQPMMLRALRGHADVQLAQNNHLVQWRAVPNDAQYASQWHHQNIDSEAAWDISTGGLTATGDTIVVCIIENSDLPHPDLIDNAWFNHAEIPNNGVDEDLNGYVDDFRGWNPATNDDDVYGGGHGTQVAGMIGATGNNGTGVSGANWNVKMMVVDYASVDEADVVSAYTYPWVMRRLYNETDGEKGAFVVATNASWGINGGQPDDSPLWCAVYDSLGAQGVLSCGATANNNVDVDVVGDLPTACSSDYMVSVTATDIDDNRTFSAYGATTIDVGAPGGNVFTTSMGGGYGTTSGTSFASPLTAGVIGLLYSAPCATLMTLVKNDPPAGALYIRNKLFEGVEAVGNLGGQTVTGGRISAGNSMELIMNNCGTCPPPYNLAATNTSLTDATLGWSTVNGELFNLTVQPQGLVVNDIAGTSYALSGLDPCTPYTFTVQANCGNGDLSAFSTEEVWTSEGCCTAPVFVNMGFVGEDLANVTWSSVLVADSYSVRYREQGTTDWTTIDGITTDFIAVEGLASCVVYEVQVTSTCDGIGANWSPTTVFSTLGCGACVDNAYCAAEGDDSSAEWIANVSIATLDNTTEDDNGYGDYTGAATPLQIGSTYPITLTPEFAFFAYPEAWSVFVDLDQDGLFSTAEELFTAAPGSDPVTGDLTIPVDATPGVTRMRVMMKYQDPLVDACETYDYGETEDYCVELNAVLAVEETRPAVELRAFPSPADRVLYLDLTGTATGRAGVTVLDESGRVVARKAMDNGRMTLTTADLADGLYIYHVTDGSQELAHGRFVVAHLW
ncbi:MAG: S8 family serine peptidase [Flavobacteriales bacterium]|nr:S8 family serine peptidase [Flavobacteriales bacterium]